MEIIQASNLIRKGIDSSLPQTWADLGCGSGTFTYALADLLANGSCIYAVDAISQNLAASRNNVEIVFKEINFNKNDLHLPPLTGIMMANALHFVKGKNAFIHVLEKNFSASKRLLIVEYDTMSANRWVPFPIDFNNLKVLLTDCGYTKVEKLGETASKYRGNIYATLAT